MRHDQKSPADKWICEQCRDRSCEECIDVLRSVYSNQRTCHCRRADHMPNLMIGVVKLNIKVLMNAKTCTEPSFICPKCGARSFNPNDIKYNYCGRCHDYMGYSDATTMRAM